MVFDSDATDVTSVKVSLGQRSYNIAIGTQNNEHFSQSVLNALGDLSHALVICDEAVREKWADPIVKSLSALDDVRVDTTTVASGEPSKSIDQFDRLMKWMLECGADRRSVVFAVGGGVIGDLAGFAAASFTRGVRFVQVPTTLLAMVDSSVGGKTGINLPGSKNMVGAFWQPKFVLIDPVVLSTLDDANFRAGLAEVIKYGVIMDSQFFKFLAENTAAIKSRDTELLTKTISRSCELKAAVVKEDEKEVSGRRAILNYGHTFGHAIENVFGYGQFLHGEAIAIGMHCAAKLSLKLGRVGPDFVQVQKELIEQFGLPLSAPTGKEKELVEAMHRDKKVMSGKLKLILPTKIGHVEICDAPEDTLLMDAFVSR